MNRFADIALARRIEGLGAWSQRALVAAYDERFPELDAAAIDVAGGVAAFLENGSPINGAMGLGVRGEVHAEGVAAVERFFRERNERPAMAIAPLVDPSLTKLLDAGGWVAGAFENVLVRDMRSAEEFAPAPDDVEVRLATSDDERELWAALVANGFAAPEDPSTAELRLGHAAATVSGVRLFIGYVDGQPAGTGELHVRDNIGWLTADTTLPQFRRRGVQGAIQRARLELARDAGCELALTEALPGSASQRNMERLGFSVVYTRVEARAPEVPVERACDGHTE